MRRSTCYFSFLAVLGLFLVTSYAMAQMPSSDQITISANSRTLIEFDPTFVPNPGSFNPLSQSFPEGSGEGAENPLISNYFLGFRQAEPGIGSHSETFNTAVALIEPGASSLVFGSDIVLFSVVSVKSPAGASLGQNWTLTFYSDAEGTLLFRNPLGVSLPGTGSCPQDGTAPESCIVPIQETGGVQDISALFLNSDGTPFGGGAGPLFNVFVQSDVEPVPEPSTLLLLGSGLAGLAAWRWHKARVIEQTHRWSMYSAVSAMAPGDTSHGP